MPQRTSVTRSHSLTLGFDVFPHPQAAEVGVVVSAAAAAFGQLFQLLGVAAAEDDVLGLEGVLECDRGFGDVAFASARGSLPSRLD